MRRVYHHICRKAFKPVPTRLFGGLAYLLVALSGLITIGVFELNVWANLGIAIVLGLCFASLGFLGHEILHGTVVRKAWLRDFLGRLHLCRYQLDQNFGESGITQRIMFTHSMKRMILMHGQRLRSLKE